MDFWWNNCQKKRLFPQIMPSNFFACTHIHICTRVTAIITDDFKINIIHYDKIYKNNTFDLTYNIYNWIFANCTGFLLLKIALKTEN